MQRITFKYKDQYTNGAWRTQYCICRDVEHCKKIYGLEEPDVEYEIIKVEQIDREVGSNG